MSHRYRWHNRLGGWLKISHFIVKWLLLLETSFDNLCNENTDLITKSNGENDCNNA
jgi:hypothetical protein